MVVHGSSLAFYAVVILWLLVMRLTVATADELEAIFVAAVRNAMFLADLTIKDAAFRIGRDPGDLRRALRGEPHYYLPFVQMVIYWPSNFWLHLTPELLRIVFAKRVKELADDAEQLAVKRA